MANIIDNGRGFPAKDLDPYLRRLDLSFAPNGGSAIDPTTLSGAISIWSVVRVSQGLYRATLRDSFNGVNYFGAQLQFNAAPITLRAVAGPTSVANRTFDVFVVDGSGAVQDVAANAANRINLNIVLRCTSLKA